MRIGSLFSGYGGLDQAVQSALGGGHVVWHSDIKPASVALLKHRHPDAPNHGDMTAIDYRSVEPIDVLAASWPCQPHSSAGKRLGEADPRALWPHVARAIEATRPAFFFGENVARISGNGELRRVVRSLAELGYVGAWRCVRAADVGACHRRDRCFVVAVAADATAKRRVGWPDRQGAGWGSAVGSEAGDHAGNRDQSPRWLIPTATARLGDESCRGADPARYRGPNSMGGRRSNLDDFIASVEDRSPWMLDRLLPTPSVADSRNTRNATAGRSEGQEHHHAGWTLCDVAHADRWGVYAPAIARHEQVCGRPHPEPTQPGGTNRRPLLSARFVEWMMLLPEGYITDVPDLTDHPRKSKRNAQLSLLGDGVVPAQGAAAFTFLLDHLAQRLTTERAA